MPPTSGKSVVMKPDEESVAHFNCRGIAPVKSVAFSVKLI